jgi:hypothetical protein
VGPCRSPTSRRRIGKRRVLAYFGKDEGDQVARAARGVRGARPEEDQEHHRHVQRVEGDAVEEGHPVGSRQVVDPARHPAAQRHAHDRRHDDETDLGAGLPRGEVFAHDDRVGRHDPALAEPEDQRDDVERREARGGQVEEKRDHLQRGADEERQDPAEPVGEQPEMRREATPPISMSDSISAPTAGP